MAEIKRNTLFIFNSKKGMTHELFFNVFELVLASIVLLAILYFIHDIANQTIFEKNYLARDLSVLLNTIYAAPGDVAYDYNENIAGLTFDFIGNKVQVHSKEGDSSNVFYPFAKNDLLTFQDKTLSYDKDSVKIKFLKSQESVSVDKPELIEK